MQGKRNPAASVGHLAARRFSRGPPPGMAGGFPGYGRAAPTKFAAYQPVLIGIFSTSIPVCGASMM
jgi:hypothetical protein